VRAGAAQRYINMEGYLPGSRAVILGSGDIGLIMARRMTLEGIEVKAVYEVMAAPGGLTRNIVQCLDESNIPLHLSTTVTQVHGKRRVEAVTIAKVDHKLRPIPGTEETVECDLLVLAVGLIPENELSRGAEIELDPRTKGPVLDDAFMTSVPGIFACGNVAVVFDLVDYVSQSGEIAAQGALDFLSGKAAAAGRPMPIETDGNVNFVVPQRVREHYGSASFFMRVKHTQREGRLNLESRGKVLLSKKLLYPAPPEMISFRCDGIADEPLKVSVTGEAEV
jgi:NADPH-dependent 2,4-dienoyl-CoA reductase/sulfur reductase-like enzyme